MNTTPLSRGCPGRRLAVALCCAALLVCGSLRAAELAVHFLNIGQGDCALVVLPSGKRLLVDCGSSDGPFDATKVRQYIRKNLDPAHPQVDVLVITHPDADHYNKLESVLGEPTAPQIAVGSVVFVGQPNDYGSGDVDEWLEQIPAGRRVAITDQSFNTYPARELPGLEGQGVTVLAANVSASYSTSNARSIVLKITHGTFDLLLAGDATRDTDAAILRDFAGHESELDVEVWKVAHHGAWATATKTDAWLRVIRPEVAVFSASIPNDYGHPNLEMAKALAPYTTPAKAHSLVLWRKKAVLATTAETQPFRTEAMYLTATQKNIVVRSDGTTYSVKLNAR